MKKILILLIFCFISCNEIDKTNITSSQNIIPPPTLDYLVIATNILAPAIGEWSTNYAVVTYVYEWSITIHDDFYIVTATIMDINGKFSSWAITEHFSTPDSCKKVTCWCGTIGGSPTASGICKVTNNDDCIKGTPACNHDCNKDTQSTTNWSNLYGSYGSSILSSLTLPTLEIFFY